MSFILFLIFTLTLLTSLHLFIQNYKLRKRIIYAEENFQNERKQLLNSLHLYKKRKLEVYKRFLLKTIECNDLDVVNELSDVFFGRKDILFNLEDFNLLMNEIHLDFLTKLRKEYPSLSCDQLYFCSLLLAEFNTKEIAKIQGIKENSVRMKKKVVREKIGIPDNCDLIEFILNKKAE